MARGFEPQAVVVESDGDAAGRKAGRDVAIRLPGCSMPWRGSGDPASDLARMVRRGVLSDCLTWPPDDLKQGWFDAALELSDFWE